MPPNVHPVGRATLEYQERGKDDHYERDGENSHVPKKNIGKDKNASKADHVSLAANDVQASAIPDPIPADNASTDTITRTTLTIPPTFSVTMVAKTASSSQVSATPEFSPNARLTTTVWIPAPRPTAFSESPAASNSAGSSASSSARLPVYGIILLALGGVILAMAALLVFRCFLRRHGHVDRPRPSAPILQESPLFGGMERLSRGIWSDPSFNNLLASHAKDGMGGGWRPLSGDNEPISEKTQKSRQSAFLTPHLVPNNPEPSQLSPNSVYTTAIPSTAVGVALEFPLPPLPPQAIHPATQPLKVKNKAAEVKSARRRSMATSLYGETDICSPTLTDAETAIAYHASRPAPTPGKSKGALKSSSSSRDNVQRPSRKDKRASQGSLYRSPSASRSTRARDQEEPFLYVLPTVKSEERRDRDTKALTSALGLASPPPPSSCFSPVSIYPDDSLSVAHGRYLRPQSEAPLSEMPSPTGTHAALGDLMLQDFPSTAIFNSLRTGDPFAGEPVKKSGKGRVTDRPPRVPSPPPLPSLSQMALANADPDYHSPTYSIYGLYEAQRKSKRSSVHK